MSLLFASLLVSLLAVTAAWLATRRDPAGSPVLTLGSLLLLLALPLLMLLPKFTLILPVAAPSTGTAANGPPVLAITWLIGFTLFGLAQLRSHLALRRWKAQARRTDDPRLLALLDACAHRLALSRPVAILLHPDLGSPAVTGLQRPVVFLPEAARTWPDHTLRMVMLHELGHLARRDLWTALAARTACLLHWFNPLVWRLRKHLLAQCEYACDARVIAAGANPNRYAEALCDVAELGNSPRLLLAMAGRATLRQRVARLVEAPRAATPLLVGTALVLTMATSLALSMIRLSPAPDQSGLPAAPTYTPEEVHLRLSADPFPGG